MEYQIGQMVYSKSGRDQGQPMIIIGIDDSFVFLVDGKRRKIDKPKKKKKKHLQITHNINCDIAKCIIENTLILDSDIRSALKTYMK